MDARDFTIWTSFKKIRFTRILVLLEFTKSHPAGDRYNSALPRPASSSSLRPNTRSSGLLSEFKTESPGETLVTGGWRWLRERGGGGKPKETAEGVKAGEKKGNNARNDYFGAFVSARIKGDRGQDRVGGKEGRKEGRKRSQRKRGEG